VTTKAGQATEYSYPSWFPLWWTGCHSDEQVKDFFTQGERVIAGNQAQYQYNAQQSASTVSADLLTTWFTPGIQAVLSGSATSGNSGGTTTTTTTTSRGTTTTAATSTDSVDTAVAKLENGGDFNVRFPLPILSTSNAQGIASLTGQVTPNVGFTVNGLSSQVTITDSTQYSFNLPFELYGQLKSSASASTPATLFFDLRPAGEFLSKPLAVALGPSVPTAMFLGQAAAGIEFSQRIRVSFQYVYGNASVYQSSASTSTGTGTTSSATPTKNISGFHLVVSFATTK
jgi:hypothetical protein